MKYWLILLSIIVLFVFLRFYNIENSLFFQNDIGRDFLVLYDWKMSGKIPLLGPQTNFIPFNQSAVYFYFLYPFFLATNMSFYSTIIANTFLYVVCFIGSFFIVKDSKDKGVVLLVMFLITVHPEIIIQNRYVWNPSLTVPLLLVSVACFLQILRKWNSKLYFGFWLGLSGALSLSYSIGPEFIAFFIVALYVFKKRIQTLVFSITSLVIINISTIGFELRHQLLLTKNLLGSYNSIQTGALLHDKINSLLIYILPSIPNMIIVVLAGLFIVSLLVLIKQKYQNLNLLLFLIVGLASLLITLLAPFTIHSHYILGLLLMSFCIVALMPKLIKLILISLMMIFWFNLPQINSYFTPAPRTVSQLDSCFHDFCKLEQDPVFVSVYANFHNYHVGPEFRYLMKKNNCNVKEIEKDPTAALKMAVVSDQTLYKHGQVYYNELSLFGKSDDIKKYSCQNNVNIDVLEKI